MNYNVVISDHFQRVIRRLRKKYVSIDDDFERLIDELSQHPLTGSALGRDCYKVRMRIKAKQAGKRGGARVITCVKVVGKQIFLLTIYDKSEQDSISDDELDFLLAQAGLL